MVFAFNKSNINSIHIIAEIQADLQKIEANAALYQEVNFDNRADAIDFIDFHILDRIGALLANTKLRDELNTLRLRAEKLKYELEEIDQCMFERLRTEIREGIYQSSSFMQMITEYTGYNLNETNGTDQIGYNNLDVFLNSLLALDPLPEATLDREQEMVFYQKTPAKIIFELATLAQLNSDDVFIDLGSGLGQVTIMMNLLSGMRSVGIEYEPAYHHYAQSCAKQLKLANVEFINQDARKGDYSKATVFFLYTPFEGNILNGMMDIIKKQAQQRDIRIFTYGPCSPKIALKNWLTCVNGNAGSEYKLYQFESLKDTP